MVEYFDLRPSFVRVGVGVRVVVGVGKMIDSVYINRILILRVGYEVDPVCDKGSFEVFYGEAGGGKGLCDRNERVSSPDGSFFRI